MNTAGSVTLGSNDDSVNVYIEFSLSPSLVHYNTPVLSHSDLSIHREGIQKVIVVPTVVACPVAHI